MAAKAKPSRSRKTVYNKAKTRRNAFGSTTSKYKSDHHDKLCTTFVESTNAIPSSDSNGLTESNLINVAPVAINGQIALKACIGLDARNPVLANPSHATYINMFNEWNTNAIYIDLLFSKELRENCDQVFMLVERGDRKVITDAKTMLSDVNCRMYQLGNNTQKLTFKHVFGTTQDRINKLSSATAVDPNTATYLKILCVGKNQSPAILEAGDCSIKMRVKLFQKYRDMKTIQHGLDNALN